MTNRNMRNFTISAALGLGLTLFVAAPAARAQDEYHGGSLNVRQHAFEHGYRDGYEYGRDCRDRHVALDYRTEMYRDADRGYNSVFGSREDYQVGYREGYRAGAEDGFNGVQTRLEQTFAWHDRSYDPDLAPNDPRANVYAERHWGYQDVASDIGYRDGVNAGLKDYRERHSYRPEQHGAYKDADHGYNNSFGAKDEYKRAYRAAYEAGYRDGFGIRK